MKQMEREIKELKRANEILRKAAAFSLTDSTAHTNNGGFYP